MESHILTTEGVAMMFEKLAKRRAWLEKMKRQARRPAAFEETGTKMVKNQLLVFSRWCQVMLRFEKSMYENPDQDLNKLWWDMVEKYQGLRRPPDRSAPRLRQQDPHHRRPSLLPQLHDGRIVRLAAPPRIAKNVYKGAAPDTVVYVGNKDVGRYMREKSLQPRPHHDLERIDKIRHGQRIERGGVRPGFQRQVKFCVAATRLAERGQGARDRQALCPRSATEYLRVAATQGYRWLFGDLFR